RPAHRLAPERLRALGLSDRQAAVARLVAGGASNPAIATELGIRPATVKKHLEHIYRVLGVRTRAAAVAALTATG
ncbi:MAG: response regulator transcription factor, partial [Acidimicrobiia bacterium]